MNLKANKITKISNAKKLALKHRLRRNRWSYQRGQLSPTPTQATSPAGMASVRLTAPVLRTAAKTILTPY